MTEDPRTPNFWWCPTHHLYRGGDKRPCADAVRLVPAPSAEEWQAAVDQADAVRADAEWQHTEGMTP